MSEGSWREMVAASDESNNRPLPVIDNNHGTFIYLDKDQFILHRLAELGSGTPDFIRLDLRHLSLFPDSAAEIDRIVLLALRSPEELRRNWPRATSAPFFRANMTTKQFRFLK